MRPKKNCKSLLRAKRTTKTARIIGPSASVLAEPRRPSLQVQVNQLHAGAIRTMVKSVKKKTDKKKRLALRSTKMVGESYPVCSP